MSRIEDLENLIRGYSNSYYNGKEEISDEEYDSLVIELSILKGKNMDTVTETVEKGDFEEDSHFLIMGTLRKLRNEIEINEWAKNKKRSFLIEEKIDGSGLCLTYENGKLIKAVTRGNGEKGLKLPLENVLKIQGIVKEGVNLFSIPFNGSIRGEIVMSNENFEKHFSKDMKNPRNCVAGLSKRLDGQGLEFCQFVSYDVKDLKKAINRETDKIQFLKSNNFLTPLYIKQVAVEELNNCRKELAGMRNSLPYNIDGMVVKELICDWEDLDRLTPLNNVAVKFDVEEKQTKLIDIEWQLAGSILSPVGVVEPVELDGTTVERVSLSNLEIMKNLGIYKGCKVLICKRGQIIPHIEKVIKED